MHSRSHITVSPPNAVSRLNKKKVGIFGGSFDPFHFGHLNLAVSLKEAAGLDLVLFVPANLSPFKQGSPPLASGEMRLEMIRGAIRDLEGFEVLDVELKRPSPSYTIDTVKQLLMDSTLELHLLLAEELIPTFHSWKEAELLIQLAPPLIGVRRQELASLSCPWGRMIRTPCFEISSTLIRERLAKKAYCGHLLPQSVLEYIQKHKLYASDDN